MKKGEPGQVVSFGPYRLDPEKVQLWRGVQEVRLTAKAFAVLRYFVEHPGQLVSKDDLFQAVWPQTVVSESTLASCIQELRQALRDDARKPRYIETVHRRGYRFLPTITTQPVRSSNFQVPSQEEEASRRQEVGNHKAKDENGLESSVQRLESDGQGLESGNQGLASTDDTVQPLNDSSDRTLDTRRQTLDDTASVRSWLRKSLVPVAVLLLVGAALTVHYLSRPALRPDAAPAALPLPDKSSIVILPFVNLSGDPGQEYFSDGMTEEITATLSRISSLFVIARTSAFTYKGKGVKVQDISRELGVRYVLEGSVRKADGRLRIIAQLIDATTGEHLWAESYDRELKDIFALQDEIVQKIVTTLKLQLTLREQGVVARKTTDNLESYDYYLRGLEQYYRLMKEANAQARQMFERAIALDPEYAEAYAQLGWTYNVEWVWRWNGADPQTLERAFTLAQHALALDDSLPAAYVLLGYVYTYQQQYDQAIAEGERAIALDPNNADSYAGQAEVLNIAGRPEEALKMVERAMRLNPRYPAWYLLELGAAYRLTGRYGAAVAALKELISRNPNFLSAYPTLADSYVEQWAFQLSSDPQTLEQALAAAQQGISLSDAYPGGHVVLGAVYLWQKQYDLALAEMERAIVLNPNIAGGYALLAEVLSRVGRTEDALRMLEQALRCKPFVADWHLNHVADAYYLAGRLEEAIAPLKQYLTRYPNILGAHLTLAAVYSELGREAEARAEVAEVLRINPRFLLGVHRERAPIKDSAMLERQLAALRKAGLE